MSAEVQCNNCGALVNPGADGRTFRCRFCGVERQVAIEGRQIATGMKLDLARLDEFLERLAGELAVNFAHLARLQRDGGRISSFEINLDPDLFVARRDAHGLTLQHKRMVRGIALKTATHPVERWVEMLTAALAAHANTSASAAQVIERIRIG